MMRALFHHQAARHHFLTDMLAQPLVSYRNATELAGIDLP
ncbi:MAG: hypothetical protein JWQ04_1141 [Pedosphaera sp.]|nr:hypothetical protein [Pedosphaera sp.]